MNIVSNSYISSFSDTQLLHVLMYCNDSIIISGVHCGDIVSVFADIVGQCKKGYQKPYVQGCKIFLGNGIVRMERKHLYAKNLKPV